MAHDAHENTDDRKKGVSPAQYWMLGIKIILILILIFWIKGMVKDYKIERSNDLHFKTTTQQTPTIEANVLVKEGYTPLTVYIDYKFEIRTEGKPINIKFQGVSKPEPYAGEGDFITPSNATSGSTVITSGNKKNPKVWVKVYKVIKV